MSIFLVAFRAQGTDDFRIFFSKEKADEFSRGRTIASLVEIDSGALNKIFATINSRPAVEAME